MGAAPLMPTASSMPIDAASVMPIAGSMLLGTAPLMPTVSQPIDVERTTTAGAATAAQVATAGAVTAEVHKEEVRGMPQHAHKA